MSYFKSVNKTIPRRLIAKATFGKHGEGLGEFLRLSGLAVKDNYLYVSDGGNGRIQVLQIQPDGNLLPKLIFGKEGKRIGKFSFIEGLAIKDNYLYAVDSENNCIQILEIKY